MALRRVFFRPDGGVSVMQLVEAGRLPGETDDQMFDRCTAKIEALKDVPFQHMDEKDIPKQSDLAYTKKVDGTFELGVKDAGKADKVVAPSANQVP